ncbi:MAG: hypothetical protein J5586_08825 [Clostridia bacterium]|nr:hypothetical protein [Clostridia bacterium]
MLFGVDFCRRRARVRRRAMSPRMGARACVCALAALIFTGLLLIAPQWLLVLLVLVLTGAVFALICLAD